MKRVGYLYEKLCNRELLELAFKKASIGKRNKRYVKPFLDNRDKYIDLLLKWLQEGTLRLSDNPHKTIYERSARKSRDIIVPKFFPDQIVHWAFCLVMKPIFMKGMYKWNCGSIEGRGIHYGIERVEKWLKEPKTKYILKTDFRKYYPSIDINKLMELLERKVKDKKMLWLAKLILENGAPGLPIGYYTSQWFANFYLENIDHYIKEELHVPYYIRYIDDLVLMDSNKKRLHNVKRKLDEKLDNENYYLTIKPNWQLWRKDSRPLDFLGFKLLANQKRLRARSWIALNRVVLRVQQVGHCSVKRAQAYISRLGWLMRCSNGINYYIENLKDIIPKGQACKIISLNSKKEAKV